MNLYSQEPYKTQILNFSIDNLKGLNQQYKLNLINYKHDPELDCLKKNFYYYSYFLISNSMNIKIDDYTFEKSYDLILGNKLGIGKLDNDTLIITIYKLDKRDLFLNEKLNYQKEDIFPKFLVDNFNKLNITLDLKNIKNVICLSIGNSFAITELLLMKYFYSYNVETKEYELSDNKYKVFSYCYNPGRYLKIPNYKSPTIFYLYDNCWSKFIPESISNTTYYYPNSLKFIEFKNQPTIKETDIDKYYPIYFLRSLLLDNVSLSELDECLNYFDTTKLLNTNTTLIDIETVFSSSNYKDLIVEIAKYIITIYLDKSKLTYRSSVDKNILIIEDDNQQIIFFQKQNTLLTGEFFQAKINNNIFDIDKCVLEADNIKDNILSIYQLINVNKKILLFGFGKDILVYLYYLNKNNVLFKNFYLITLGYMSITKNFPGFNKLDFKDYKIINILNDKEINLYYDLNYDKIITTDVYDVEIKNQKCLHTIFGYTNYLI